MAMCEKLGQATRVQNQYDDTKDEHQGVVLFVYRSVFVVVAVN